LAANSSCLEDGLDHQAFRNLAGEALDHQHGVFRAGDDQVQVALLQRVVCGKGDELAVDVAQPHGPQRALKRQRREQQRGRRPIHRQHVAVVLPVGGQHEALNLDVVPVSVGELGPDRTIHEPCREGLLDGRTPLAL
jgi:hypothetical protein